MPEYSTTPRIVRSRGRRSCAAEDALRTVLDARLGRTSPQWMQRDLAWFTSGDRSHPFAFEVICEVLDLDASWLRCRLARDATRPRNRTRSVAWRG